MQGTEGGLQSTALNSTDVDKWNLANNLISELGSKSSPAEPSGATKPWPTP